MEITIWVAYDCNMGCTYCYEREKKYGIMDEDMCKEVLQFVYKTFVNDVDSAFHSVVFHGGEPLLNYPIIVKIVQEIKAWNINVPIFFSMTTNAVLLDREKNKFLVNNMDEISVSIDGTRDTHCRCRCLKDGTDYYDAMVDNIKSLLKYNEANCNFRARMTVTPESGGELYQNVKYLCDIGFTNIIPVLDCFSEWKDREIENLYKDMTKVYTKIAENAHEINIGLIDDISMREPGICLAGIEHMHISPKGQIFPCAYVMGNSKFLLGNVIDGVESKKVKWLKSINEKLMNEDCEACSWKNLCEGNRCRLLNYAVTGDYFIPSQVTCLNERLHLRFYQQYLSEKTEI